MSTAIWWVRRDLRLTDNRALSAALSYADNIVPTFVLDPRLLAANRNADKRLGFLTEGLRSLDAALAKLGSRLVVRHGDPVEAIPAVWKEARAEIVIGEADYSPYARRRDAAVAELVPLELVEGLTVVPPGQVLKADGSPYVVFTPFSRSWRAKALPTRIELLPPPVHIDTPDSITSERIPDDWPHTHRVPFVPGESEGLRRLDAFVENDDPPTGARATGVAQYADQRDFLAREGTSGLSPYLRFGMVSAGQAVVAALESSARANTAAASRGAETWLNELIWREFYIHVLYHFPHVARESFRDHLPQIRWSDDQCAFVSWQEGRTGYPVVDAGMRQLLRSGWMHNRARMIVASFLVKDLLIDWRWGERHFMDHLVDGDPASNNGGWQWAAGTGTDAAPYFRVFNPVLQAKRFDADGAYVRRWLPEIADVPNRFIHEPWKMPASEQARSGCEIGSDYPPPIVDHAQARERALAAFAAARH